MKKMIRFIFLLTTVMLVSVQVGHAAKENKIGFVDLSRLFDEYYKTKDFDKVLEAKHKEFEESRNKKIEEIRESQGKLGLLTDKKKAELEEKIEKMKAELLEFDRQRKTDLTKERNEKIRELLLEIEKIVSDYAGKENYSVILNDRVLIFGDQSYNLTEQILNILNANQK